MPPPLRAAARLGVTARAMNDEDLPFVAALYASTREEELAALPWPDENKRAFLEQQHRAQHAHYRAHYADADWLILEREGQPIGRLYLDVWQDQLRIIDISLIAEARGEGIGGGILADIIQAAGSAGKGVSIHVEKTNPARRLYERLGFELVEDKGVYDLMVWRPGRVPA